MKFYRDCEMCKYRIGPGACQAFPNKIPREVWLERERHDKILPEQIGDYLYSPDTSFIQIAREKKEYETEVLKERARLMNEISGYFIQEVEIQGYDFDSLEKAILEIEIPSVYIRNFFRLEVITKTETIKLDSLKFESILYSSIRTILAAQRIENKPYRLELIVYSDKTSSVKFCEVLS